MNHQWKVFSSKQGEFVLTIAKRVVPQAAGLNSDEQIKVVGAVDDALAMREPALRMQFLGFLGVIKAAALTRYFRPLGKLPGVKQDALLNWFQDSAIQKFRVGFWGLRTMIYMGYYGDSERAPEFNYMPDNNGNKMLKRG